MSDNPIHEMIAAFSVGCMDKENFIQFKEYLIEGGELPTDELGELQNIVAMIPIILDLETPDPSLKDSVAKKLIGMQDEIKTKIREEKRKTFATRTTKSLDFISTRQTRSDRPATKTKFETKPLRNITNTFRSTAKIEIPDDFEKEATRELRQTNPDMDEPESLFAPRKMSREMTTDIQQPEVDKGITGLIGWVSLILSIILFIIVGYYTYNSVASLKKQIGDLDAKVTSLRTEITTSTNFVNKYISLIEFFNYRDITLINLSSPDPNEKASAKVLLAYNEKEGLIQFKNVKQLQPNQGYQVWVVSKSQAYSLGVFSPNGDEYMRITNFPFIPKEQIDLVKITIESNTGSPTPSVENYLVGVLPKK